MKDRLNITIRLADLPAIPLQIDRDEEPDIRAAEYNVNKLWRAWTARFANKSSHEVLGMVAFQFAKTFVLLNKEADATAKMLDDFEQELDRLLLATGVDLSARADED